ncbi:hypothetical protein [Nitrosomonas eutropha]|nr:hypothetical protein [Nitrosomonas eutropha]
MAFSAALMVGSAKVMIVRSMEYSRHGRAITAKPIHSRRVALAAMLITE